VNKEVDFVEIFKQGKDGKLVVNNHNWGDVPASVVEQEDGTSLIECIIDLVKDYEQLLQNGVNTFQYNDQAKLKVTGYAPEEPLTVEKVDSNGNKYTVANDKRIAEDKQFLEAKVFYTPNKDGDIAWIEKNVNDSAFQNALKTLIDLILMMTGVPNVTDLGFTKADNASAIDRKFFNLEQMTIDIVTQLEMAYKRRWELIFNRLNLKHNTKYDFRDVKITLQKNLPANESEVVDSWLKLRGLVSDETIIERLPYGLDALVEQNKMEQQEQSQLEKDLQRQDSFNQINGDKEQNKDKENNFEKEEE
jgi:SPP1 family phage portal protein